MAGGTTIGCVEQSETAAGVGAAAKGGPEDEPAGEVASNSGATFIGWRIS